MRPLSAEEHRLWDKVVESVRPYRAPAPRAAAEPPAAAPAEAPPRHPAKARATAAAPARPGTTLDGSWDRRLSRGAVQPDLVLDLHGHDLATAYDLLDARLEEAIARGSRMLLLITGKAPGAGRDTGRGRIRAAMGDWLAASRHAGRIAAVRGAHPRHGGAGALYIVLRKAR